MDKLRPIDSPLVIAERLQQALAVKNVKQKDLAAATGFSRVYINLIVNGKKDTYNNDSHLRKIANALTINPNWLIHGSGTMDTAAYAASSTGKEIDLDSMQIIKLCQVRKEDDGEGFQLLEKEEVMILPQIMFSPGASPFAIKVESDIIGPLLSSGDYALIRASPGQISDGHLYAIWFNGRLHFRFIMVNLKGTYNLSITQDGKRSEALSEEESSQLTVIGRVIARLGSID